MIFPVLTPEQVQLFLFSFLRVSAIIVTMPIIGNAIVPMQVKGGISLLITIAVYPFIQRDLSAVPFAVVPLLVRIASEVAIGVIIGFTARFIFAGIQFAGDIMGFQMGFSIANMFDPMISQEVSILSEFQFIMAMIIFLFVDAHHIFFIAMVDSFQVLHLQELRLTPELFQRLVTLSGDVFVIAVKISAPILAVMLFINIGLGVIARTVPQINVFVIGIPLQIALGLIFLGVTAPIFLKVVAHLFQKLSGDIHGLLLIM
jgi:flagellar biosynthetic protein FliR